MEIKFDFDIGHPPKRVSIEILPPQWRDGIGTCDVTINGESLRPIQGIDPLNALQNALLFVETYIATALDHGDAVTWANGMTFAPR